MYPTNYYIALGTNVGNYKNNFSAAISELSKLGQISKIANIYKSKPYGYLHQNYFYNSVLELKSKMMPIQLMKNIQLIESDYKKATFLQEASRICNINTKITVKRVESLPNMRPNYVVARAFAPIDKALLTAKNQINKETKFVLHKGSNAIHEINEVKKKLKQENYLKTNLKPAFRAVNSKTDINAKIIICTFKNTKVKNIAR